MTATDRSSLRSFSDADEAHTAATKTAAMTSAMNVCFSFDGRGADEGALLSC